MKKYLLYFFAFLSVSCNQNVDLIKEERIIKDLLAQERTAHFNKDVDLFVSEFADSMISINKGKVKMLSPEQNKIRIEPYFKSIEFIKWDDVENPMISFSADGTMAYAVVQKQVILSYPDSTGKLYIDTTDYAWVSIYRKHGSDWKIEANISTNK